MEESRREEVELALSHEVTRLETVLNRDEIIKMSSGLPVGGFVPIFTREPNQPLKTSNGVTVEYLSFGSKETAGCKLFRVPHRKYLVLNLLVESLAKPIFYEISFKKQSDRWVLSDVLRQYSQIKGGKTGFTLNPVTDPGEALLTLTAAREVLEM